MQGNCGQRVFKFPKFPRLLPEAVAMAQDESCRGSTGQHYEDIIDQLAQRAALAWSEQPVSKNNYLIGIAGAPGSGKSTLARAVADRINEICQARAGAELAVMVPMDGFHFYKRQLDAMPNPKEAYARRGAHWTFDAQAFVDCIQSIAATGEASVPSFDHGIGDPEEDQIRIKLHHKIILVEGNYVLLGLAPWNKLRELFDDTWFVDVNLDTAMKRVFKRQTSIGLSPEVSRIRIETNDLPNGQLIEGSKHRAAVLVPSSVPFKGGMLGE